MKSKVLFLSLFFALSAFAEQPRNGNYWATLNARDKTAWAIGWMDGFILSHSRQELSDYETLTSFQLAAGLDQFYVADYRNMSIDMTHAAEFVAQFRLGLMTPEVAAARIQSLRMSANGAH